MRTVVVGAGAFGASLAWRLARGGDDVVLVDQFAPGDARASSGGETRLIRCAHGDDAWYSASARRARELWRELEAESGTGLYVECGVVWFAQREDGWEAESERTLAALAIPAERVDPGALFPQVEASSLAFALLEPQAGVLRAQRAVETLAAQAVAHGARLVRGRARPSGGDAVLEDGGRLEADAVVWACGGWLGGLFGAQAAVRTTRQDLYFFDVPAPWRQVPAWVDYDAAAYGTPDLDGLGLKAASDREGPPLDCDAPLPDTGADTERATREYVARRFPSLADAPLRSSRSCRYELSPDSHFIAARHPEHAHAWLVGGGSGHGFKHGPALAERVAAALHGAEALPARFALGERRPGRSLRTAGSSPTR